MDRELLRLKKTVVSISYFLTGALALLLFFLAGYKAALGIILGNVLSCWNFARMAYDVDMLSRAAFVKVPIRNFLLRYLIVGLALMILVKAGLVNIFSLAAGLFVVYISIYLTVFLKKPFYETT